MAYIYKNPNPMKKRVGDCVIRGISILTNQSWIYSYICIVILGRYADSGHEDKEELMRKINEMKRQLESM